MPYPNGAAPPAHRLRAPFAEPGTLACPGDAAGTPAERFSTYVSRRADHEVTARGSFASIRLRDRLAPGTDAAARTQCPLVCRADIGVEAGWPRRGGILPHALHGLVPDAAVAA